MASTYQNISVDTTHGTTVSNTINDGTNSTSATSAAVWYATNLTNLQDLLRRQLLAGYDNGQLAQSWDHGATWTRYTLAASVQAVCAMQQASASYPQGYAGCSGGQFYSVQPTQNASATSVVALLQTLPSGITALSMTNAGQGKCWIGCTDGSLWVYDPAFGPPALQVAQLSAPLLRLVHLGDLGTVFGICNDGAAGFFQAYLNPLSIVSINKQETWNDLSGAGRGALLLAGTTHLSWSSDAGTTFGNLPSAPAAGSYPACGLNPIDPNEWLAQTATGGARTILTQSNGQSYTSVTGGTGNAALITPTQIVFDPTQAGIVYAVAQGNSLGKNVFKVSYDSGNTWADLLPSGISTSTVNALCLALGALTMA